MTIRRGWFLACAAVLVSLAFTAIHAMTTQVASCGCSIEPARQVTIYQAERASDRWRLVSHEVPTTDYGGSGLSAVRALTVRPGDISEINGWVHVDNDSAIAVVGSVVVREGVITVDLSRSVWDPDPDPAVDVAPSVPGRVVMQQLVWTVTEALGIDAPVRLTVNGRPARGVRGFAVHGPVSRDPAVRPVGALVTRQ